MVEDQGRASKMKAGPKGPVVGRLWVGSVFHRATPADRAEEVVKPTIPIGCRKGVYRFVSFIWPRYPAAHSLSPTSIFKEPLARGLSPVSTGPWVGVQAVDKASGGGLFPPRLHLRGVCSEKHRLPSSSTIAGNPAPWPGARVARPTRQTWRKKSTRAFRPG